MSNLFEHYDFRKETRKQYFKAVFVLSMIIGILVGGTYTINLLLVEVKSAIVGFNK